MTALCSGGASQKKAGIQRYFNMTGSSAAALLNNVPTKFAVPLAAALASTLYDLDSFCDSDPPAMPTFDLSDALAFAAGFPSNPFAYQATLQKVADLVKIYAWYQFCQCASVTTPPAPTPPTPPTDWPDLAPGPTVIPGPCNTTTFTTIAGTCNGQTFNRGGGGWPVGIQPTAILYHNKTSIQTGTGASQDFKWEQVDANNVTVKLTTYSMPPAFEFDQVVEVHPSARSIRLTTVGTSGTGCSFITGTRYDAYCGVVPGQPLPTCCPPDPQIVQRLEGIWEYVQLLQRQIAPFAFVNGEVHGPLSGSGSITVDETIVGIRVSLDPLPSHYGLAPGTPDYHFDVGFASLGDADGWFGERRLTSIVTTWQPRWAGAVTRIGYTLSPGVTAAITELEREAPQ